MNKLTDAETIKRCPVCGSEPMGVCYTSNPPQYGYSHCDIDSGYCKSEPEAREKWNEQVYLHQQKKNEKTDAEIVKTDIIEILNNADGMENVAIFAFDKNSDAEFVIKATDIIDTLNRQNALVESMQKNIQCVMSANVRLINQVGNAKEEAIKEFAERFKHSFGRVQVGLYSEGTVLETIDNLVKEMVGETDGKTEKKHCTL